MSEIMRENVKVRIGDLKLWENNPKYSTKAQALRIEKSWKKWGQVITIAFDKDMNVVDGHQRINVLNTLYGADYIVDGRQASVVMTEENRRELVVTLHAGAVGTWDWDALSGWDVPSMKEWGMNDDQYKDWKRNMGAYEEMINSEEEGEPANGSLLSISDITIAEPKHKVIHGDIYRVGKHTLICAEVLNEWEMWMNLLEPEMLLATYPGPYVPLSIKSESYKILMVQPSTYIAGHILDRYVEIKGEKEIQKL